MFARRSCAFSEIYRRCTAQLGPVQRRWAQVEDVRFLVTHPRTDRIAEKYRDKLQRKAREEGLQSVDELKAAYKERTGDRNAAATTGPHAIEQPTSPFPLPPSAPVPSGQVANYTSSSTSRLPTPPGLKTLSSYLDLNKTRALPPKEIEYVWRLRHAASPTSLCAILPSGTYTRIIQTARKYPHFILPLPRKGSAGAEIHFLQFSFAAPDTVTVMFTHLAEYKLRGEFSQPHTTITMHAELMQDKGLVLMQGQVVDGRGVTVEDARWLVLCLQKFYSIDSGDHYGRAKLLQLFSKGDGAFKIEELVEEAEKIV
ncbi:MAG: hypothetical protein Q9210_001690 [Variospora velana]